MSESPDRAPSELLDILGTTQAEPLVGGRTNRLWRAGHQVAKLYSPNGGTPLFANSAQAEWDALTALRGKGLAPNPLSRHRLPQGDCLIYEHLPGTPGAAPPDAVARMLHRLHSLPALEGFEPATIGQGVLAEAKKMLGEVSRRLDAPFPLAPTEPSKRCIIHRDPVPANIVSTGSGAILIDWQCPGLGDPLEDIAHFLSPAMQALYGGDPAQSERSAAFLAAYPEAETAERYRRNGAAFHYRVAAYCAWKAAHGDADYARALPLEIALLNAWPTG